MKRLIKNKFMLLAICIIIVSLTYFGVQKAIASYSFNNNDDIITEEEKMEENSREKSMEEGLEESNSESLEQEAKIISEEDVDFVTEGENTETDNVESGNSINNSYENGKKIYVYITGEVNNPGVVILDEESRIVDAINAAGGTTVKANISKVNLVYVLDDGMKVNIPNDNDLKNNPNFEYITMNSGDGGKDDYSSNSGSASSIDKSSNRESSSSNSDSYKSYTVVNINTATQTELETLPGIGPSLALKIINYRKENGKFSTIDEIKNVNGIGENKFNNLKEYIII